MFSNVMRVLISALLIIVLGTCINSQTLLLGPCPDPPMPSNFSAEDFMGRWYEMERSFVMAEMGWQCITIDYMRVGDRLRVETVGRAVGVRRVMTAQLSFGARNPAVLTLNGEGAVPTQSQNKVLFTDYDNVAIVWSCRNSQPLLPGGGLGFLRNLTHTENLWILSRKRTLDAGTRQTVFDFLDQHAINRRTLGAVSHSNCPETQATS